MPLTQVGCQKRGAQPTADGSAQAQWALSFSGPGAGLSDGGEGWGVLNFLLPPIPASQAQAGGSDRDKASAGALSVTGASCSPGVSPAGLIKFLRAEEGQRGRWREGGKTCGRGGKVEGMQKQRGRQTRPCQRWLVGLSLGLPGPESVLGST